MMTKHPLGWNSPQESHSRGADSLLLLLTFASEGINAFGSTEAIFKLPWSRPASKLQCRGEGSRASPFSRLTPQDPGVRRGTTLKITYVSKSFGWVWGQRIPGIPNSNPQNWSRSLCSMEAPNPCQTLRNPRPGPEIHRYWLGKEQVFPNSCGPDEGRIGVVGYFLARLEDHEKNLLFLPMGSTFQGLQLEARAADTVALGGSFSAARTLGPQDLWPSLKRRHLG